MLPSSVHFNMASQPAPRGAPADDASTNGTQTLSSGTSTGGFGSRGISTFRIGDDDGGEGMPARPRGLHDGTLLLTPTAAKRSGQLRQLQYRESEEDGLSSKDNCGRGGDQKQQAIGPAIQRTSPVHASRQQQQVSTSESASERTSPVPSSTDNGDIGSCSGLDAMPYIRGVSEALTKVSISLQLAMTQQHHSVAVFECLRDVSLSVAVLDRSIADFVARLLRKAGVEADNHVEPLHSLVSKLSLVPSDRSWRLLPAGGTISMMYHFISCMEQMQRCFDQMEQQAVVMRRTREYGYPVAALVALAAVARLVMSPRPTSTSHHFIAAIAAWARGKVQSAAKRIGPIGSVSVALALVKLYRAARARLSVTKRLSECHDQLLILLRMWYIITMLYQAANPQVRDEGWHSATQGDHGSTSSSSASEGGQALALPPDQSSRPCMPSLVAARSYTVLLQALSQADWVKDHKPIARQLLEVAAMPRASALWPSRGWRYAALKRLLDVFYASMHAGWKVMQLADGNGNQSPIGMLRWPVTIAAVGWYSVFQSRAADVTARLMVDPDVGFISSCWRLQDMPWLVRLANRSLPKQVITNTDVMIAGVRCQLISNVKIGTSRFARAAIPASSQLPSSTSAAAVALAAGGAVGGLRPSSLSSSLSDLVSAGMMAGLGVRMAGSELLGSTAGSSSQVDVLAGSPLQQQQHQRGRETQLPAEFALQSAGNEESKHMHDAEDSRGSYDRHPQRVQIDARHQAAGPGQHAHAPDHHQSASAGPVLPPCLLFIHGGGFVGASYSSDIQVLADWICKAEEPLCVVYPHYSLAPEARYPQPLNECYEVFSWVRRHAAKVVMVGESAGGLLATATTIKAIQQLQSGPPSSTSVTAGTATGQSSADTSSSAPASLPDGLLLAYPALNLNPQASPSRALHMSDPLIPYHLLVRLAGTYQGRFQSDPDNVDPLIHPSHVSDDALRAFPPVHIAVGGLDPLLDESIDITTRLKRLHKRVGLEIIRSLPHGFMNFNALLGPDAQAALERMRQWGMREMGICGGARGSDGSVGAAGGGDVR